MAGKTKLDVEFDNFATTLAGWFESQVEIKTGAVLTQTMNSKRKREQLAARLNETLDDAQWKLREQLSDGYHGGSMPMRLPGSPWIRQPWILTPTYAPLSHRYELRKKRKGLDVPSYFLYTGDLLQDLTRPQPKVEAQHIRVSRVMSGEHERTVQGKKVMFYQLRNELGQFMAGKDRKKEREWLVQVLLPPNLKPDMSSVGGSRMDPEETFFGKEQKTTIMKLTNPRGPYRPLINPFLRWYSESVIQPTILHTYSTSE